MQKACRMQKAALKVVWVESMWHWLTNADWQTDRLFQVYYNNPLVAAVEYVRQLRSDNKELQRETDKMRKEIEAISADIK